MVAVTIPRKPHQLRLDLVPESAWGSNVRSLLKQHWPEIKKFARARAGDRCECCKSDGRARNGKTYLDTHELWRYEKVSGGTGVQVLDDVVVLCKPCHEVHHYGLAQVRGNDERARRHLKKIRGWTDAQATQHIAEAFDTWIQRNRINWLPDMRWIQHTLGHKVPGPQEFAEASRQAVERMHAKIAAEGLEPWATNNQPLDENDMDDTSGVRVRELTSEQLADLLRTANEGAGRTDAPAPSQAEPEYVSVSGPGASFSELDQSSAALDFSEDPSYGYLLDYGPFRDLEQRISDSMQALGAADGSQRALQLSRDAVEAFRESLHAAVIGAGPALYGEGMDAQGTVDLRVRILREVAKSTSDRLHGLLKNLADEDPSGNEQLSRMLSQQLDGLILQIEGEGNRYMRALSDYQQAGFTQRMLTQMRAAFQSPDAGDLSAKVLQYRDQELRGALKKLEGAYAEITKGAGDAEWEAARGREAYQAARDASSEVEKLTKGLSRHLRDSALSRRLTEITGGLQDATKRLQDDELAKWVSELVEQIRRGVDRLLSAVGLDSTRIFGPSAESRGSVAQAAASSDGADLDPDPAPSAPSVPRPMPKF